MTLNDQEMHVYVEARLSEYIDDRLPADEHARIQNHLKTCDRCSESLRSLLWTVNLLKQAPVPPLPRTFTLPVPVQAPARRAGFAQSFGLAFAGVAAVLVVAVVSAIILLGPGNQAAQPAAAPQIAAQFTVPASGPTLVAENIATPTDFAETKAADQTQTQSLNQGATPAAFPPNVGFGAAAPTATRVALLAAPPSALSLTETTPPLRTLTTLTIQAQVVSETLSVREGPDNSYREIVKLKRGEPVNVIGREPRGEWLAIRLDNSSTIGWVEASGVRFLASESVPTIIVPTRTPVSR